MKRLFWAGLAVMVITILALAGCGNKDQTETDREAVKNASLSTTPAPLKPGEKAKGMQAPPP